MSSPEEQQVIDMMHAAKRQLGEFCNAVLIVCSFDHGENASVEISIFGPNSHAMGLAAYAQYEIKKNWDTAPSEPT